MMRSRLFWVLFLGPLLGSGVLRAQGDPCSLPGADDAFEDNDDCASAVPLAPGLHTDLVVRDDDPDHYAITLQAGERVDVHDPDGGGALLTLLDAGCSALDGPSTVVDYTNAGPTAEIVILEARTDAACQTYDLAVDVAPNPCVLPPDGDSCTDPELVTPPYLASFLPVSLWDFDYYAVCVPPGATTTVRMTYVDFLGYGISVRLFEWDGTCSSSIGSTDILCCTTEVVTYTNTGSASQYVVAEVQFWQLGGIGPECGQYDIEIYVDGPPCSPPETYCTGKLSTAGCVPQIAISGVPSASIPAPFQIEATDVVNFKNGIVFYGFAGATAVPFLGGTLCVVPPLRRAPLQNSGGSPPNQSDCSGGFSMDFNAWIQSGQDPMLVAGQEIHAQHWFRDPQSTGGAGLSDAARFTIAQ